MATLLLLLQVAVAGPPGDRPPRPPAPAAACGTPDGRGEIVVCARTAEEHRLKRLPERYDADAAALPRAETGFIGRSRLAVETEQAGVAGAPSNRAMMRLKLPF